MKFYKYILAIVLLGVGMTAGAQMPKPVTVKLAQGPAQEPQKVGTQFDIVYAFTIDRGWHVYAPDNEGGPIALTFNPETQQGVKLIGGLQLSDAPIRKQDPMFGCEVTYFEHAFTVTQRVEITGKEWQLQGYLEYGACNEESCLPPQKVEFDWKGQGVSDVLRQAQEPGRPSTSSGTSTGTTHANNAETKEPKSVPMMELTPAQPIHETADEGQETTDEKQLSTDSELFPQHSRIQGTGDEGPGIGDEGQESSTSRSLLSIFLMGLLGGLIALFTPCVWPIIPMTVSFFLKRSKDHPEKGVRDAILYGLSIVVIFVALGLLVTLIWGPSQLNALATNAVFNLFLFALLVVFAASFLGGFELTLPASWNNKIDAKASSTTGVLSIFLMAFTLVLVSFSCTAPIVGLLLVDMVTSGNVVAPLVGMLGFSLSLAIPFALFAMFPAWLKAMPKSGNWMNVIKVVLGLVELAFALKFFSVADLAYGWRLLDRETFLCLWIMIFAFMGFYLLGWIRLPHDEAEYDEEGNIEARPRIGVPRFFLAMISLAFALYMVPGLWGAPCKAVSAFAPPMWTQDFKGGGSEESASVEPAYTDYELAVAASKKSGKPILIDFTGFGCVNCRKMEAAVWTDKEVRRLLTEEYILVSLFVDDKTALPEQQTVTETDGTTSKLRTVGDRWSYLQRSRYGAQTQPFYVVVDANGKQLSTSFTFDEEPKHFTDWLENNLSGWKKSKAK